MIYSLQSVWAKEGSRKSDATPGMQRPLPILSGVTEELYIAASRSLLIHGRSRDVLHSEIPDRKAMEVGTPLRLGSDDTGIRD